MRGFRIYEDPLLEAQAQKQITDTRRNAKTYYMQVYSRVTALPTTDGRRAGLLSDLDAVGRAMSDWAGASVLDATELNDWLDAYDNLVRQLKDIERGAGARGGSWVGPLAVIGLIGLAWAASK